VVCVLFYIFLVSSLGPYLYMCIKTYHVRVQVERLPFVHPGAILIYFLHFLPSKVQFSILRFCFFASPLRQACKGSTKRPSFRFCLSRACYHSISTHRVISRRSVFSPVRARCSFRFHVVTSSVVVQFASSSDPVFSFFIFEISARRGRGCSPPPPASPTQRWAPRASDPAPRCSGTS
jgi:hypothetical protein